MRAAEHGHSMEEEAREILTAALASEQPGEVHIVDAIRRLFEPLGGVDLPEYPRESIAEPPDFSDHS